MDEQEAALANALAKIGCDERLRRRFIEACLEAEGRLAYRVSEDETGSVRDDITAPIVDALHAEVPRLRKRISSGELFEFLYRSKIAREFVMSVPEVPDHVWEPQTTKLLLRLSQDAEQVLIGGAYFGDHAILVAEEVAKRGGVCHAFEPNVEEAETLAKNCELNHVTNMKINRLGLWSSDGAALHLVGDDSHAHPEEVEPESTPQAFRTVTIDSYLAAEHINRLDLIMLDIEGGEFEALRGARGQLDLPTGKAPATVFEVHSSYVDWSDGLENTTVVRMLLDAGFKAFAIRDFQGNADMAGRRLELVPVDDIYLEGPQHGFNVLAVKDQARLDALGDWRLCPGVSPKLLMHKDPALHLPLDGS